MWLQFDIRTLCINHWGSDEGITVLKQLGQLYMFLIWETIVLETVSRSDTSSDETKVFDKDLEMLKASTSASQEEPSGTKQYLRCISLGQHCSDPRFRLFILRSHCSKFRCQLVLENLVLHQVIHLVDDMCTAVYQHHKMLHGNTFRFHFEFHTIPYICRTKVLDHLCKHFAA